MISVKNISKSYDQVKAVVDVSFQVEKGEIVGLLGPNGAGKTTILRLLAGLLNPDQGEIIIGGRNVAEHSLQVKNSLGFLSRSSRIPKISAASFTR